MESPEDYKFANNLRNFQISSDRDIIDLPNTEIVAPHKDCRSLKASTWKPYQEVRL